MATNKHPVTNTRRGGWKQVELEVLLPAEMTVRNSHEIGLALQQEIETHERVERSFVHIDYKERPHEEHFDPATGECGTFEA